MFIYLLNLFKIFMCHVTVWLVGYFSIYEGSRASFTYHYCFGGRFILIFCSCDPSVSLVFYKYRGYFAMSFILFPWLWFSASSAWVRLLYVWEMAYAGSGDRNVNSARWWFLRAGCKRCIPRRCGSFERACSWRERRSAMSSRKIKRSTLLRREGDLWCSDLWGFYTCSLLGVQLGGWRRFVDRVCQ